MIGLDKFKEYFMGYQDQYVLIGGAACDIIFEEQDTAFRNAQIAYGLERVKAFSWEQTARRLLNIYTNFNS